MLRLIIGRGANYPNIRVVEVPPRAERDGAAGETTQAAPGDRAGTRRMGAPARGVDRHP